MITGAGNLRDLFLILHDGAIADYDWESPNLTLWIEIAYLAQRVSPTYQGFKVKLLNARDVQFVTWPRDQTLAPIQITSIPEILAPELDILNCRIEGETLKVICNQSSSEWTYCGGELQLKADGAVVTDPCGKHYAIGELARICNEYWENLQRNAHHLPAVAAGAELTQVPR